MKKELYQVDVLTGGEVSAYMEIMAESAEQAEDLAESAITLKARKAPKKEKNV